MVRGLFLTTLVVLLFAAQTQAQVALKHKFPDGRKSTTTAVIKTAQTLTLGGMDLESGSEQTLVVTATNGQRAADGTLIVKNKIEALKSNVTLPGGVELEFDSAAAEADPPGTQFDVILDIFKATAKSSWDAVMDRENHVISIKGRDAAYAELPESLRTAMKAQIDPEYLKTAANDELNKLPSAPVSSGDSWERTNTVRLDSGQTLTFTKTYTYEGSVEQNGKKLEKIVSDTTKVEYAADATSPLKVVESNLEVTDSSGQILFEQASGQIVSQSHKVQIKGPLKLEVAGMELAGSLDLVMENTTTTK